MSDAHMTAAEKPLPDPIANVAKLLAEYQTMKSEPLAAQFATCRLLAPKMAEAISDLLGLIHGLRLGNAAELKRRERLVFELLSAMQPLFGKETSPFGRQYEARRWLSGTAPRLREVFDSASTFLGVEWIDMASDDDESDDAAEAS